MQLLRDACHKEGGDWQGTAAGGGKNHAMLHANADSILQGKRIEWMTLRVLRVTAES
jgi:hypothetical protein